MQHHRKQSKELQDKLKALLDLSNLLIQSRVVEEHSDKLMVIQALLLKGIFTRYDIKLGLFTLKFVYQWSQYDKRLCDEFIL